MKLTKKTTGGINLEKKIIAHCAPTLAGLKTANMFTETFISMEELMGKLEKVNEMLNKKGVFAKIIKVRENRALIYVYRKERLQKDLKKEGVWELLSQYGYTDCELASCLEHLKNRLAEYECFPHEIGVFLDYPLEDVLGFIRHGGKNCKYCGIWKVYSNECETRQLFARYKKCTHVYVKVFARGRTLTQLTVAA